jgi:aspartyl-tRNA synthetase
MQSRTHNLNELRIENAGERVVLVGWLDNVRKVSKNLAFLIMRDFYGKTQVVIESEELMNIVDSINIESTISVTGLVRERSSKNKDMATGDVEVVPEAIEVLGKCIYNELPFAISHSKEADENKKREDDSTRGILDRRQPKFAHLDTEMKIPAFRRRNVGMIENNVTGARKESFRIESSDDAVESSSNELFR